MVVVRMDIKVDFDLGKVPLDDLIKELQSRKYAINKFGKLIDDVIEPLARMKCPPDLIGPVRIWANTNFLKAIAQYDDFTQL